MAKDTVRDQIWESAMKRTLRDGGQITVSEVAVSADSSKRSARDALETMVEEGILSVSKEGRENYYELAWEDYER